MKKVALPALVLSLTTVLVATPVIGLNVSDSSEVPQGVAIELKKGLQPARGAR